MSRKIWLVLMVLGLLILLVPGCGGGNKENTPTPTLTLTPIPTAASTATATPTHTVVPTATPIATTTATATPAFTPTPSVSPSGIEMVSITGGTFSMGSGDSSSYEKPVHSVTLSPFSMSRYEITYAQWVKVRDWGQSHGYSFNMPGAMGGGDVGKQDENHPVTYIKWYDAVLWCNALSEMEGRTPCYYTSASQSTVYRSGITAIQNDWVKWNANGYRLPTEAEWEYACRAGTTTDYSFGNSISGKDANYRDSGDSYDNGTTPVGNYAANSWGLYDMHGNVWEWCWDWYGSYDSGAANNPKGPYSGSNRVPRGGGWNEYLEPLRSADRIYLHPASEDFILGFRPVSSQ